MTCEALGFADLVSGRSLLNPSSRVSDWISKGLQPLVTTAAVRHVAWDVS